MTGTRFGRAQKNPKKPETVCRLVGDIMGTNKPFHGTKAMRAGSRNEHATFTYYRGQLLPLGSMLEKTGLWINKNHSWLAASPDGLIKQDGAIIGVLEIQIVRQVSARLLENCQCD